MTKPTATTRPVSRPLNHDVTAATAAAAFTTHNDLSLTDFLVRYSAVFTTTTMSGVSSYEIIDEDNIEQDVTINEVDTMQKMIE